MAAIESSAFIVAVNPDTTPILAAARYGAGRVVVAGDDSYFKFSSDITDERKTVARNILSWVTETASPITYREALQGQGKLSLVSATTKNWTIDSQYPIEHLKWSSFTDHALDPAVYPVAYVDGTVKAEEIPVLEAYIRQGGNVVVPLKGWVMEQYPSVFLGSAYEGRSAKLSEDFPVQRLLNQVGLGLMNNTATTKTAVLPKTTVEQSVAYHMNTLRDQSKKMEAGTLTIDDVKVGAPDAAPTKKLQIMAAALSGTFGTLTPYSSIYAEVQAEAEQLNTLEFPLDKSKKPYTSALLSYKLSQIPGNLTGAKSPYADVFPGVVPSNAERVRNVTIPVSFDYSTYDYLRQGTVPKGWVSTGLYAPAGEWVKVQVPPGVTNLDVQIGAQTDNLSSKDIWDRVPVVFQRKTLTAGENLIRSPYGGLIYLIPTKPQPGVQTVVTISDAVQAPYYVLGRTTAAEWQTIRNAPAPWAELQGRRVIVTVPSTVLRTLDDPEQVVKSWDAIVDFDDELAGLAPDQPLPHQSVNLPFRYVADIEISAGFMHAGYPIMFHITPSAPYAVDNDRMTRGGWGFWHETGHEYQQVHMNWGVTSEITVNIYSLYVQQKFGNSSNLLVADAQGKTLYDKAQEYINNPNPNKTYGDTAYLDVMGYLVMFRQLSLAYGWEFYTDLHRIYRELPAASLPKTNQEEIDLFVVNASRTAGYNLLEFFDKWSLPYTKSAVVPQVQALNLPTPEQPVWQLRETNRLPSPVLDISSAREWSNGPVTVTLRDSIADVVTAEWHPMAIKQVKVGNGGWTDYTAPLVIETEGETAVSTRYRELSGVTGPVSTITVKIDQTAPTIQAAVSRTVNLTDLLTVTAQVYDSPSGVESASFYLDGKPVQVPLSVQPLDLSVGQHVFRVTAKDAAGNEVTQEYPFQVILTIDRLDELFAIVKERGWIQNEGLYQSVIAQVQEVQKKENRDQVLSALKALENHISAQAGKQIDAKPAQMLLDALASLELN
ncbi:M60 family metallopeptidase [Paenibacillus sp. HJGM_3]|uniref:M60 family metallopeptidase n=1 Tax=Paenibacillus sp. HJGM_3 TaxID=3379816 RepID=UPI003858EF52